MGKSIPSRKKSSQLKPLEKNREELAREISQTFLNLAFENRFTLHPRRLRELGAEEVKSFIAFFRDGDIEAVNRRGGQIAQEGLGRSAILALSTLFRDFYLGCLRNDSSGPLQTALQSVDQYMNAYLNGYMIALEAQTLKDQEQLRKALADALEQQRRELFIKNHAIHTSINGIMLTDLEGRISYVNPSFLKMWGYEAPAELIGVASAHFLGGDKARDILAGLLQTEGWHGELTARRKDGSATEVEVSASLILDTTGSQVGIMASYVDITERKRLESQFRQAQKMDALGQLASGIVHDVNNLLTAISGYAQLELMEIAPSNPMFRSLAQIKTATDRGRSLTQQLRVFTRQTTGERRSINLNTLVQETYELLRRTFPPNITIDLKLDPDLNIVNADPSQMSQLLMNLCVNARDAMTVDGRNGTENDSYHPTGGQLTVVTSNVHLTPRQAARYLTARPGDYVCVTVSDTGIGMNQRVLDRLFEPFFTTKGERSGTGLGLAVVYGIVQNHQGFIDVRSTFNAGSTFEVYLPVADRKIEGAKPEEPTAVLVPGRGTVLVVEDELQVREMVVRTLQKCGYEVMAAEHGLDALNVYEARKKPIDLVILDMIMPKMNGWDCFHRLKKADPQVKVLIMTGYTSEGNPRQLLSEGAVGFIEKPLNLQMFTQAVQEGIRR
jgi:PAS domain S-box-containing protein